MKLTLILAAALLAGCNATMPNFNSPQAQQQLREAAILFEAAQPKRTFCQTERFGSGWNTTCY